MKEWIKPDKLRLSTNSVKFGLQKFRHPAIMWSGGKDSTAMLHLIMTVCDDLNLRIPDVIFIDHNDHFDEIVEIVRNFVEDNGLYLVVSKNRWMLDFPEDINEMDKKNRDELKRVGFNAPKLNMTLNSFEGNHLLKTVPMIDSIKERGYDALFVGIRASENAARSHENMFSKRNNPLHMRIHPMLMWTEDDVWSYIRENRINVPSLYQKGYRSLDGKHSSYRLSSDPAWLQDKNIPERAGRSQDKEGLMEKLRRWGYL